jgi:hypothetical protein
MAKQGRENDDLALQGKDLANDLKKLKMVLQMDTEDKATPKLASEKEVEATTLTYGGKSTNPLILNIQEQLPLREPFSFSSGVGRQDSALRPSVLLGHNQLASGLNVEGSELRSALAVNLQYQALLKDQLKRIEQARTRNQELQKQLKSILSHSNKKPPRKTASLTKKSFNIPFFTDLAGNAPPDNPDAIRRKKHLQKMPGAFKVRKWNNTELKKLRQGVRQANQEILFNKLMEQLHGSKGDMERFKVETEAIRNTPPEELEHNVEGLDWDLIAKYHVPTRSGADCKIQWLQNMHPAIEKKKFTKAEDKQLLDLAKKYKAHNWEAIAKELGTNRTPAQCFKRYQRSLNTNMMKSKWTAEEDKILIDAVKRYGEKNWQQVAHCLEGRTGQQCLHRWQKTLNPHIRRGRWTTAEDMMLTLAVKAYGSKNWIKIQAHVPGRTDMQCRERWVNILNPALNNGPWTEEEDNKLKQAIEMYGLGKWSQVSQMLHPRTDNQCWRRWKALNAEDVEGYRRTIIKKRKGLVNNFVGREKERPNLTTDDFEIEEEAEHSPSPSASGKATEPKRKRASTRGSSSTKRARRGKQSTQNSESPQDTTQQDTGVMQQNSANLQDTTQQDTSVMQTIRQNSPQ